MARLLGLGDGNLVESYEQFREHIHRDDRERVDAAFAQAARDGGDMQVEFRVVWPDGTVRWLSDHGEVVRDDSGGTGVSHGRRRRCNRAEVGGGALDPGPADGCGGPSRQARIFEPFFTTKPVGQGSGLGLATVFGIVRQSGGAVRLRSSPGEGTTFNIYLPQEPADEVADIGRRVTPRGERGSGTVLVVEDEAQVRDFTCRVLVSHGYQCVEASNGVEALEVMRERGESIDAVVTDVVMPGLGGGALATRLVELCPSLPVLFTSAYTGEEVVRRGLIEPDAPFLQKPFSPQALVGKLGELRIQRRV